MTTTSRELNNATKRKSRKLHPEVVAAVEKKYKTSDKGRATDLKWRRENNGAKSEYRTVQMVTLTDSYIREMFRCAGVKNPTPKQIEFRRRIIKVNRALHSLALLSYACRTQN